jgi:3-hydroxypropanoate dehydrogenase
MPAPLPLETLQQLFTDARSINTWTSRPVEDGTLRAVYDLMKMGPTSANLAPARLTFVRSAAAKAQLLECISPSNVEKVASAPVTVIISQDSRFYDHIARLYPDGATYRDHFASDPVLAEVTALRNSSLQGAYFMLAARALGLDCGPMSGFNNAKLDASMLAGTTWKSNFICTIGYGDRRALPPRLPRLPFEEACRIS